MTFDELKDKAHSLPLKPGVYIMQDVQSTVIYVGKAKALKNRVSQYFQDSASHTEKTRAMVAQIDHFDVIIADSEFEALVLECSLIKRHQPRYNILLKDSKGYPYIRLSNEAYPRFSLASRAAEDGARYFGPYAGRHSTQGIIEALRAALRLPSCSKRFPRDCGRERPCLNFHMGKCDGYCRGEELREQHGQAIAQAVSLLEGRFKEVKRDLTQEMERAAEELRFERANGRRSSPALWRTPMWRASSGGRPRAALWSSTICPGSWRPRTSSCWRPPWRRKRGRCSPPWSGSFMRTAAVCPSRS